MPTIHKTIIVLANSVRDHPNRCVAGREWRGGAYGRWLRPVSPSGHGEVSLAERTITNGREVSVLDIVRVPVAGYQHDLLQPENWIVEGQRNWELIRRAGFSDLHPLAEEPEGIWLEPDARVDSISAQYLNANPVTQSLYLLRLERLRLRYYRSEYHRRRRRALFEYAGLQYDLAVTDPVAETRYQARFPGPWEMPYEHTIEGVCYICVSLAHEPFQGRHYKLVATIFDPAHD